jgi:hypothetical protein
MSVLGRYWASFISFATALCSLFSGFMIPVPSSGGENPWFKYGKFLVAVCIGLWFVPERTWNRRKHKWYWWFAALILALGSSASVFNYTELITHWTVPYWRAERVVIGETLTEDTKNYLRTLPNAGASLSPLELLKRSLGDPTQVWRADEVELRQRKLTLLYLLTLFLLSSAVVTTAQAAYCSTTKR